MITIKKKGELIILDVYVYVLAIRSKSVEALKWLKKQLINVFNMKDFNKVMKIIGWEIT